jgi:hypothetical protein
LDAEGCFSTVDHYIMSKMFTGADAKEVFSLTGPAELCTNVKLATMACTGRGTVTKVVKVDGVKQRQVLFQRPKEMQAIKGFHDIEAFHRMAARDDVELGALSVKFANPLLKHILVSTGDAELWHCRGLGGRGVPVRFTMLEWLRDEFRTPTMKNMDKVDKYMKTNRANIEILDIAEEEKMERKRTRKDKSSINGTPSESGDEGEGEAAVAAMDAVDEAAMDAVDEAPESAEASESAEAAESAVNAMGEAPESAEASVNAADESDEAAMDLGEDNGEDNDFQEGPPAKKPFRM